MLLYKSSNNYISSVLYNLNYYLPTGEKIDTVSQTDADLIQHIKSGEEFYLVNASTELINQKTSTLYRMMAFPADKSFFWPVDLVEITKERNELSLVFPCRYETKRIALSELSKNNDFLGVEKKYIKQITLNIINAFESLYKNEYLYYIWDDNIIYVNEKDYSILLPFSDKISYGLDSKRTLLLSEYHTEFIDPYVFKHKTSYDFHSEMYVLSSLLFRLLIGRFPFEGSLMDGITKDTDFEFQQWVQKYTSQPVFIFDKNDKRNALGTFSDEEIFINRWKMLTDEIRSMFMTFFEESNIMRKNDRIVSYLPNEWRVAINKL